MATQYPTNLIGPAAALTASLTTYSSATNVATGIVRTVWAMPQANSLTLTIAFGADAAGTRLWGAVPMPATGTPYNSGGLWLLTPHNSAHAIDASSSATGTQLLCNISGYEYY